MENVSQRHFVATASLVEKKKILVARIRPIESLSISEQKRMYEIFSQYYDGHTFDGFHTDLNEKHDVILLLDKETQKIQGFSTLLKVKTMLGSKQVNGIYSGDTILEKQYWGNSALGRAFLKYLFLEKLRHPFTPLYWFLISKGYKTYLLMANNFGFHYPRFEKDTPKNVQELLKRFYNSRFQRAYNPQTNLIESPQLTCRLKGSVADIDSQLIQGNPRIAFFVQKNPRWNQGVELACIAEMTFLMPLVYTVKKMIKGYITK